MSSLITQSEKGFLLLLFGALAVTAAFSISMNRQFNSSQAKKVTQGCVIAGCSNHLCVEASEARSKGVTTCEYKEEYTCYEEYGTCERQSDGNCGWTQNSDLIECLEIATDTLPQIVQ